MEPVHSASDLVEPLAPGLYSLEFFDEDYHRLPYVNHYNCSAELAMQVISEFLEFRKRKPISWMEHTHPWSFAICFSLEEQSDE